MYAKNAASGPRVSRMFLYKLPIVDRSGFTLAEMIVAMAIFLTAVTTLSSIFIYSNRTQRKTQAIQETQTDARFAMEVMAQQVRRGVIDYDYYGGTIASDPQDILALVDGNNNHIQFQKATAGSRGVLQISQDNGASWSDLTPSSISISALSFYLSPATDPFAASPATNQQPFVTITLHTTSTSTEGATLRPTFLQTSVSTRQYLR